MKLLCDEMLKGLAKWLRAAGYDTELAQDSVPDREVLQRALGDGRILITRDRKLPEHRDADRCVLLLNGNSTEELVCELNQKIHINWHHAPFSRCMECNTPLQEALPAMRERLLSDTREMLDKKDDVLWWCSGCNRLYWEGGHVRRIRDTLDEFDGICR